MYTFVDFYTTPKRKICKPNDICFRSILRETCAEGRRKRDEEDSPLENIRFVRKTILFTDKLPFYPCLSVFCHVLRTSCSGSLRLSAFHHILRRNVCISNASPQSAPFYGQDGASEASVPVELWCQARNSRSYHSLASGNISPSKEISSFSNLRICWLEAL